MGQSTTESLTFTLPLVKIIVCIIKWNNSRTSFQFNITSEVRQGSVLSPNLLNVYPNQMLEEEGVMMGNFKLRRKNLAPLHTQMMRW